MCSITVAQVAVDKYKQKQESKDSNNYYTGLLYQYLSTETILDIEICFSHNNTSVDLSLPKAKKTLITWYSAKCGAINIVGKMLCQRQRVTRL